MPNPNLLAACLLCAAAAAPAYAQAPTQAPAPAQAPANRPAAAAPKMAGVWTLGETRSAAGTLQLCSASIAYDGNRSLAIAILADKTIFALGDPDGNFTPGLKSTVNIHFDEGANMQALAENATATNVLVLASPQAVEAFATAKTMIVDTFRHVYFNAIPDAALALKATRACAEAIPKPAPAPAAPK